MNSLVLIGLILFTLGSMVSGFSELVLIAVGSVYFTMPYHIAYDMAERFLAVVLNLMAISILIDLIFRTGAYHSLILS